jgi:four helix bundle protein
MQKEIEEIINRNKNINRGYRALTVWKESIEFYKFVTNKIRNIQVIPYKVKAQIEDSALSVSSNIAEGYCRRFLKENIQYINISLASMGENYSQTIALLNSGDIDTDWFNEYDKLHYSLENKLIKINQTYISKLNNKEEWKNDYIIRETNEPAYE